MNVVTDVLVYVAKWIGLIALLPFLLPAFLIVKLMGYNIFNLDGMGIELFVMFGIAGALAIGTGFFFLGTLI